MCCDTLGLLHVDERSKHFVRTRIIGKDPVSLLSDLLYCEVLMPVEYTSNGPIVPIEYALNIYMVSRPTSVGLCSG